MIIGTDISIAVCKAEGYLMLKFDGRKKFTKKSRVNVFAYYPHYCNLPNELILDTIVTFAELEEIYNAKKAELDRFAETNEAVNFENPTIYDLLNLASDINAYCGLEQNINLI